MGYQESDFITKMLRPYFFQRKEWKTCHIEAKVSKGKTCPFTAFQEHQLPDLQEATRGMVIYKPSDMSFGRKPADLIITNKVDSWIAILFEKEKTPRTCFHLIHVKDVLKLQKTPDKKSISREDCENFGKVCYL